MTKARNGNKQINLLQVISWFLILFVPFLGTGLLFLLALKLFPVLFFAGTGPFGWLALIGVGLLASLLALITCFLLASILDKSLWNSFETRLVHFFKGPFFEEETVEWETLLHQFEALDQRLEAKSPETPQREKALAAFNQGHYSEAVLLFDSLYALSPTHKLIKAKASIHLALQKMQTCPSMPLSELSAIRYLLEEIILAHTTCDALQIEAYQYQALISLLQQEKNGTKSLSLAQALLSQQAHPSALMEERQQLIALLWIESDDLPALREKLLFKAVEYQKLDSESHQKAYHLLQHIAFSYATRFAWDTTPPSEQEESSTPSTRLNTEENSDTASDEEETSETTLSPYSLLAQDIFDTDSSSPSLRPGYYSLDSL